MARSRPRTQTGQKDKDRGNECRIFAPPPSNIQAGMPAFQVSVWAKGDTSTVTVEAWIDPNSKEPLVHQGGNVWTGNLIAPVGTFRIFAEATFLGDPMDPPKAPDDWGDYTGVA